MARGFTSQMARNIFYGGTAFFVTHMHILEPIEVVPTHRLQIFLQERRQALVIRHQVHIVAIADVLPDLLLAA